MLVAKQQMGLQSKRKRNTSPVLVSYDSLINTLQLLKQNINTLKSWFHFKKSHKFNYKLKKKLKLHDSPQANKIQMHIVTLFPV